MNNVLYAKLEDALQAWIEEAQEVLGFYHNDLWRFSKQEKRFDDGTWDLALKAFDIIEKAKARLGVRNFFFLTDRGLSLFFRLSKDGKFTAWIGGWGVNDSPDSYLILTMLLRKHGLLPVQVQPSDCWLENHLDSLSPDSWNWVKKNLDLIR